MASRLDPSAEQLLLEMQNDRLYGEVVVKFEGGKIVLLKRTETIKPHSIPDRDDESREG